MTQATKTQIARIQMASKLKKLHYRMKEYHRVLCDDRMITDYYEQAVDQSILKIEQDLQVFMHTYDAYITNLSVKKDNK